MPTEQEYLDKIKADIQHFGKPERAECYRMASVCEKLCGFGDYDKPTYRWCFDGIIYSMGSCDEPHPDLLNDFAKITTLDPYNADRRIVMRVPIWYWDGKWEILEREVSAYRTSHYGFKD